MGQYAESILQNLYWYERAAFQRSLFGRCPSSGRLLANDVMATIFISLFFFFFFFFPFLLRRDLFSWKDCSDQKTYLAKVVQGLQ